MKELLRQAAGERDAGTIACRHSDVGDGQCGGCPLMGVGVARQRALKAELCRRHGIPVEEVVGDGRVFGYRHSAKRIVASHDERLVLGSYARKTHLVAVMGGCKVDHPAIVAAFDALSAVLSEAELRAFDEATGSGDLRYVWAKTDGTAVLVTLFVANEAVPWPALARKLVELAEVAGCVVVLQNERGNAIRSGAMPVLGQAGIEHLSVEMLAERHQVGALGFVQPNPVVAELAYRRLLGGSDAPLSGERAFDLYAGAGATTRWLKEHFRVVRAAESIPESAAALGEPARTVEAFMDERLAAKERPDLVIANPPRAGMGERVCAQILASAAPRLHIMSCHPRSLARDLGALQAGGYSVDRVWAFDTLPQTVHVELVAWLTRA